MNRPSDPPSLPVLAGKLGGLSLGRQVATLAVWPLLENMLTFLVGVCDVLVSSRMAEGARKVAILDAMGLGSYVGWFFNILQGAVAVGVMALVSRATGARDTDLARRGMGQGAWLGLAAGIGSLVLLLAGKGLLVSMMGLSSEAQVLAHDYLFALAWSGPFSGAMMAMNAALRGSGDTRTPFLSMVVVNVVNVSLSILFVYGPEPWGGHGVAGIAWGTVCGWVAGAFTVALAMVRRENIKDAAVLRWTRSAIAWHKQTMMRIVRVGVPQSMEVAGMWSIHFFGIQTISNLAQEGSLGAHMIAIKVESMSFMPGFAIATAAAALTGQYLGAGSKEMAVRAVRFCWKLNVVVMCLLGLCFVVFREELVHLLAGDSEQHLRMAAPLLFVCAFAQPAFATCILLKTTMRGAGATPLVMKWAFSIMIFFRIGVLWTLREFTSLTLVGVWTVFAVDLCVQSLVFSWLHFRGKWLEAKV
jgi:putative MATE family efflux protein